MKKCQSPYVVSFYGAFLNDGEGTMSLCMEYAEGGSLLDVYQRAKERGGIIGEAVLERIAESVCKGLVYLHSQKLIHRGQGKEKKKGRVSARVNLFFVM